MCFSCFYWNDSFCARPKLVLTSSTPPRKTVANKIQRPWARIPNQLRPSCILTPFCIWANPWQTPQHTHLTPLLYHLCHPNRKHKLFPKQICSLGGEGYDCYGHRRHFELILAGCSRRHIAYLQKLLSPSELTNLLITINFIGLNVYFSVCRFFITLQVAFKKLFFCS